MIRYLQVLNQLGIWKLWIMDKKVIQIRQSKNIMQLTWVINNICTNQCDYCPPSLHAGTNHHYDWEKAKSFINRLINRYKSIHCSISGGEPTLSPFFRELVKIFYDSGNSVGITSNGVRSVSYWDEIAPYLSYICFSYHPQFEDKFLLDKAIKASNHTHIAIRVMMDNRYWDQCVERFNEYMNCPFIKVEPVRILSEMAGKVIGNNYTDEQEEWFKNNVGKSASIYKYLTNNPKYKNKSGHSEFYYDDGTMDHHGDTNVLINAEQNDFRGWACNIGLESLFISFEGWVKKGNCFQGGDLFHINEHEKNELPVTAEICVQHICHCGTDVLISKVPVFDKEHPIIKNNENVRNFDGDGEFRLKKNKTIKIILEQV